MRFHSTIESIEAGEFTWLAITECVLATALYLAISLHFHSFHYYTLAIALAPLTLLRTDAAVKWALERYRVTNTRGQSLFWSRAMRHPVVEVPLVIFVFLVTIAWGFIYRIASVAYWSCRQPVASLRQMPRNWLRQALCIDLYAPPEIVPGEDTDKWEIEVADASGVSRRVSMPSEILTFRAVFLPKSAKFKRPWSVEPEPEDWGRTLFRFAFNLLLFAPAYLVPLLYRTSLKATCIVYAPFVWVAGATAGSADSLRVRLERIAKGEFEKSRRGFANLVLLIAVVKFALNFGWIGSTEAAHEVLIESVKLVEKFLEPKSWPWWQIALVCDALVTWGLFWGADAALSRMNAREDYRPPFASEAIAVTTFLRAASAVAVVAYLVAMAVAQLVPIQMG
jgi:hypothetical protein